MVSSGDKRCFRVKKTLTWVSAVGLLGCLTLLVFNPLLAPLLLVMFLANLVVTLGSYSYPWKEERFHGCSWFLSVCSLFTLLFLAIGGDGGLSFHESLVFLLEVLPHFLCGPLGLVLARESARLELLHKEYVHATTFSFNGS